MCIVVVRRSCDLSTKLHTERACLLRKLLNIYLLPAACVVPFWHMKVSDDLEVANMEIAGLTSKPGKFTIPWAKNTRDLEPGESLVLFRAGKVEKKPEPLKLSSQQPVKRQKRA